MILRRLSKLFLAVCFCLLALPFPADARPALWRVHDADTTIYVFGSLHVMKPGTAWLDDDLREKLLSSDEIFLEIPARDNAPEVTRPLLVRYGFLPKGDALKNHLPPDLYAALIAAGKPLGLTEPVLSRFQPWMADNMLSITKLLSLGYTANAGVETTIFSLAAATGRKVDGLERIEDQFSMLANLAPEQNTALLRHSLKETKHLGELAEGMATAWMNGDLDSLNGNLVMETYADVPGLRETLVDARNRKWADIVADKILTRPGTYFIAVGVGHLIGDTSLIHMLEDKGVRTERLH